MLKIKKKAKFKHHQNRMKNEGDIKNSRAFFYSKKSKNLHFLIEKRFDWMNDYIDFDSKGLEVGTGPGLSKEFIKCKDFKISDYTNDEFLDYKNINVLGTPFSENSFDFIICSNMIHHVPYPKLFFKEMNRILKKNGKLIIQDVSCSVMHQIITLIMKHEGFNFETDVFSTKESCTDNDDLWSGNIAIPDMIFEDKESFYKNINGFKIIHHKYSEFLCFINSGGVISKTFYVPLNKFFLKTFDLIDRALTRLFPSIFALQQQLVLIKL
tara:strand:- start:889 stop:1692 length:804 start_codon:yes stop_codon:yes gene_type:complete